MREWLLLLMKLANAESIRCTYKAPQSAYLRGHDEYFVACGTDYVGRIKGFSRVFTKK